MSYNDRIDVTTPEGLVLELPLAGAGSRFMAALLDLLIQVLLGVVLFVLGLVISIGSPGLAAGLGAIGAFVILFGYQLICELVTHGRTPGKAHYGLRVCMTDGSPMTGKGGVLRNILRIGDFLPFFYAVGLGVMLVTKNDQRLGDLAARTVVVREEKQKKKRRNEWVGPAIPTEQLVGWDASRVTPEEFAAVRQFLQRRQTLKPEPRAALAARMATPLRTKTAGPREIASDEDFLVIIDAVYRMKHEGPSA